MQRLIIETDSAVNADFLASFLRTVRSVKKVVVEKPTGKAEEPTEPYNWTNPSRPATDEEFEQMISEAEAEEGIPAKEARALTMKKIAEWKKQNLL